jgi:hypothetical protein
MSTLLTKNVKSCKIQHRIMSEIPSNPEAFDPREQLALLDLIEALQEKVEHALSYEEKLRQLSVQEGQAGARTTNIASHDTEGNEYVVGPHHLIVWIPEHGDDPLFGITRLEVRMPDDSTSDLFLRLFNTEGDEQNFLLNSKGLKPFNLASTDVIPVDPSDFGLANFVVKDETICVPAIGTDVFTLDAVINSSYKYFEQPRNPQKDQPGGQVY